MELTEEQKIQIQMSMDGVPTYGATTYRNWPKRIPYYIDSRLGKRTPFKAVIEKGKIILKYQDFSQEFV